MKRSWNSGRRSAIERKARRENARMVEELRWLLDGRESKIRALEGRIRKVEMQNEELAKAVIETSVAVHNGQCSVRSPDGRELVFKTERFAVTFDFNRASFPRFLVDEIPQLALVAHLIQEVLVKKVNALDCPDVGKRNLEDFARDYCCCPLDGSEHRRPGMPFPEVQMSDAFKRALLEGRIL